MPQNSSKNILLIHTPNGSRYATIIYNYLWFLGFNCYISDEASLEKTFKKYKLKPENTLIHSRVSTRTALKKLAELEKEGFRVVNSSKTITLTSNKFLGHEHAEKHGLPVAKTFKIPKTDITKVKKLLNEYKALVLKPVFSQGQGIYCQKVDAETPEEELRKLLDSVPGELIQVQQFIDYKHLIRMIVINFQALAEATTYDTPDESWKCSVCLNPKIKKYTHKDDRLIKLAEKTARAFNAQVNYIDFFEDKKGNFILNEINTACNLRRHERTTQVKIHEYIGDFLAGEAKKLGEEE